jgi:hypothetical protein
MNLDDMTPMEQREYWLHHALYVLRLEYERKCAPVFRELTAIKSAKPQRPFVGPDGNAYVYRGIRGSYAPPDAVADIRAFIDHIPESERYQAPTLP